jgi:hypothetical protein
MRVKPIYKLQVPLRKEPAWEPPDIYNGAPAMQLARNIYNIITHH